MVSVCTERVELCRSAHARRHGSTASLCHQRLGGLTFERGVRFNDASHRFCCLSSLSVVGAAQPNHLLAVAPQSWMELPRKIEIGCPSFIVTIEPLLDIPFGENQQASVAAHEDGSLLVGFTHSQRLWRYAPRTNGSAFLGRAHDVGEHALRACNEAGERGGGLGAMEYVNATHLLVLCGRADSGTAMSTPALLIEFDHGSPTTAISMLRLEYSLTGGLAPVGLARLPRERTSARSRGLLVLERSDDVNHGAGYGHTVRIRWLGPLAIDSAVVSGELKGVLLAELLPSLHHVANFEAIAVEPMTDGMKHHAARLRTLEHGFFWRIALRPPPLHVRRHVGAHLLRSERPQRQRNGRFALL